MARADRRDGVRLDAPKGLRTPFVPRWQGRDRFGRFTEAIAMNARKYIKSKEIKKG